MFTSTKVFLVVFIMSLYINCSFCTGHTDCVRGLSWIGQSGNFLSCSNDACIRQWSLDGTCLYQYYGHRNFVYSITVLPSGNGESSTCALIFLNAQILVLFTYTFECLSNIHIYFKNGIKMFQKQIF